MALRPLDDDSAALLTTATIATAAAFLYRDVWIPPVTRWLLRHHLLVPTDRALLPLTAESGLDLPRLMIIAATSTLALLLGVYGMHRRGRTRQRHP